MKIKIDKRLKIFSRLEQERKFDIFFPDILEAERNKQKFDFFNQISAEYRDTLSPIQLEAIKEYQGSYYRAINSFNRGNNFYCRYFKDGEQTSIKKIFFTKRDVSKIQLLTAELNNAIKNAPKFPFDLTLFRVANIVKTNESCEEVDATIEEIVNDTGIKSFSTDYSSSLSFCRSRSLLKCAMIQIRVPAFTPLLYLDDEDEVIFSTDTKLIKLPGGFTINLPGGKVVILNAGIDTNIFLQTDYNIIQRYDHFKHVSKLYSELVDAAKSNNIEIIQKFFADGINFDSTFIFQAMQIAAENNNEEIVQFLVKKIDFS